MEKQRPYHNFFSGNLKIILAITCVVLVFLLLRQCSETKEANRSHENALNYLNDTIGYYQDEKGKWIAHKSALHGENESLNILLSKTSKQLSDLREKFDKVSAAGEIETITEIDTIEITYRDTIPYEFSREWSKTDKSYFVKGRSSHIGVSIDSLSIPNKLSFVIGEKDTGFWKSEYRIEAVNSNPFVKTNGLDAYSLKVPKKRFGLSIYAGYGFSDDFTPSAQIGIGISFDLIKF